MVTGGAENVQGLASQMAHSRRVNAGEPPPYIVSVWGTQAWLQASVPHPSWSPMVRQALGHCALISFLELEFPQQPL